LIFPFAPSIANCYTWFDIALFSKNAFSGTFVIAFGAKLKHTVILKMLVGVSAEKALV
jgi:hypothetical protein